jgi:hypothetical protein
MTPQTFTGSRWATVPRAHYPANVHHCDGPCGSCASAVEAAEEMNAYGWLDQEQDMDARADRDAGGL